ncbi:MAG: peptidoglycan DD-metalloendopeptidase family protein [Patescibacteria group bacterium]
MLLKTGRFFVYSVKTPLIFAGIVLSFGFFNVQSAQAGWFSFLDKIFQKQEIIQPAAAANVQTIPLLNAPTNENLLAGIGGGEINIVENAALSPVVGPLGSLADVLEEQKKSEQISIYVVREKDTLSQIAKLFDVSVNTIIWANDEIKRGDMIKPGQTLIILPVNGVKYTVKKGDTFLKIAKELKADADEIMEFNGLTRENELETGMEIVVPNGEYDLPKYDFQQYPSAGSKEYAGYYLRPINGGRRSQGLHGYNAVDLAAPWGTPVLASASGDVIISKSQGWNGGYGTYIVIAHPNGTQTLYSHLSKSIVFSGWHVAQGQIIGYVGSSGKSSGPHVHFEIRGGPRNPF